MTSVGRITFALARDGAFPYSDLLSEISVHMKSPVNSIIFVALCDTCLQLIPLDTTNGSVAFNAIIGLCVLGFQLSYALPIFFKVIFPQPTFPRTAMDLGEIGWGTICTALLYSPLFCIRATSRPSFNRPLVRSARYFGVRLVVRLLVSAVFPHRGASRYPHIHACQDTSVVHTVMH